MSLFSPKQVSTQDHLDIEDIREDMVVLKNGKISIVLETTSLNFDLLADREQDTRIYTFAGLLNSLNFPIQIVIRTQQTDVSKYLNVLEDYKQTLNASPLLQQINIYQEFIQTLTSSAQILNKRFYAIIPTMNLTLDMPSGTPRFLGGKSKKNSASLNAKQKIEKAMLELNPKRDHLIKQFGNMGLVARQLRNDELIKLYYSIYEPDKAGIEVLNIREDPVSGGLVSVNIDEEPLANRPAKAAENPFQKAQNMGAQVNQQAVTRT